MRVLIISTRNFGYSGGISNVILNYYRSVNKNNIKMDFIVQRCLDEDLRNEIEKDGNKIFELNYRSKFPLKYMRNIKKIVKKGEYDIVHAHGNSCTLAIELIASKQGGADVVIPHSHNTYTKYKTLHYLLRGVFNKSYTHGFACGVDAGNWLFQNDSFTVINNGIQVDDYLFNNTTRELYRKKLGVENNKVVGNIGAFNHQKNHDFIIKVFQELYQLDQSYRLVLVGEGVLKESIEKKVDSLGLSDVVTFAGKSREVPQLMQAMDMILMPSRYEGLPLTLLEAQAAGLQCFTSDIVTKEVNITNTVKYISLEESPQEWALKMQNCSLTNRILSRDRNRSSIVKSGYSIIENAVKLEDTYRKILLKSKTKVIINKNL